MSADLQDTPSDYPSDYPSNQEFPSEPPPQPGFLAKVRSLFTVLLLMGLSAGVGYGVGYVQQRATLGQQAKRHATELESVTEQLTTAQAAARLAQTQGSLMEARALLFQSVYELDQQNFGNANSLLRQASETVTSVEYSKDEQTLAAVKEELSTAEINFATNPAEQRKRMLAFADQLRVLVPDSLPEDSPPASPAPTAAPQP